MRPQRFSCGCLSTGRIGDENEHRFNEAAAIQLRMLLSAGVSRMYLSGFNEAAAIQLRMPPSRLRGHRPNTGFNEAAAIQLRMPASRARRRPGRMSLQ